MHLKNNKDKALENIKKKLEKEQPKFIIKNHMKRRLKNSQEKMVLLV